MESQDQAVNEQTMQQDLPKAKKCKHVPVIILLVILLLGSCGFAGFELWQGMQKDSEIAKLKENKPAEETPKEEGDAISVSEANEILKKYIGDEGNVRAYPLSSYYNTFVSEFNEQQKAFLTYSMIDESSKGSVTCVEEWHEKGMCTEKSISFETMDEKYKELFGDNGSIEEKDYAFQEFFYIVYDESINGFREYILPGGGTTPVRAIHKVVSVDKKGEDMVATLIFAEVDFDADIPEGISGPVSVDGGLLGADKKTEDTINSMALYEFTLSPYNGTYVLTGVKKK